MVALDPRFRTRIGAFGALLACFFVALLWPYPQARLSREGHDSVRIVDRHGRALHERPSSRGTYSRWVPLSEMSPSLLLATLSAEDSNFYHHFGIDPGAVARALWLNLRERRLAYGGSTITQQLAKVLRGSRSERTLWSKLAEARDALRLELWLSKEEILEQYLNRIDYGRRAQGAEAAARRFFGKSASELGLDEAALLAILPRAPAAYDPDRHPELARRRRAHVLAVLARRGWVSADDLSRAEEKPIVLVAPPEPRARHVLDALPKALLERARGELRTTIDLALTERLDARLSAHLADLADFNAHQAAIVVLSNATGEVLAMLGSRGYAETRAHGAVNGALSRRPPGSALKPFVYALALERGQNPSSPVFDVPTTWRDFQPRNASREHRGLVRLRDALGSSMNVPAVRAAQEVGVRRLAELLVSLGLAADAAALADAGLALALGSARVRLIDLANAYATLARGGEHLPWRLLPATAGLAPARRVLDGDAAASINDILSDAHARRSEFGVETPLDFPFPIAVKTGTSKSFCDNVVVGYTPDVTIAVWVGNFDGSPMHGLLAMAGAAPLFRDVVTTVMAGRPGRAFDAPPSAEPVEVCALSGLARGPSCPSGRTELVPPRHRPHRCDWHGEDGTLRVPPELRAFGGDAAAGDVLSRPGRAVRIESPAPAARFALDALLPRSRQKLALRAKVTRAAIRRVRWEVDGEVLAEAGPPYAVQWPLRPGRHRVSVVAVDSAGAAVERDEVEIHVTEGRL